MCVCEGRVLDLVQMKVEFPVMPKMESPSHQRGRDAAVVVQRLHPSVGSSVVNHSKCIFYTLHGLTVVCERVCVCVSERECVCNGTFSLNALLYFFQDSIREL